MVTIAVVTVTAIAVGVGVGVVAGYYFVLHLFTSLNYDFYKGSIQAMYIDTIIHYGLIVYSLHNMTMLGNREGTNSLIP